MDNNFAIHSKIDSTYITPNSTENANEIGNRLNNNGISGNNSAQDSSANNNTAQRRTLQEIDKAIMNVIKNYDITLEEAKKLINQKSKFDTTTLEDADTTKFNKILLCLSNALKDSILNGHLDQKKLQRVFAGYKYLTMYRQNDLLNFDDARKKIQDNEKKSLVDFIKEKSPDLRDKPKDQITAADLKEAIKKELKSSLTQEAIKKMKAAPNQARSFFANCFSYALENCDPSEKNMLFEAFVMLIQDKEMSEFVPMFASQMCEEYKNNPEKLSHFMNEILPTVLQNLGFKPEAIAKIVALTQKGISEEALLSLIKGAFDFLKSVDPNDIPQLLNILEKQQNKDFIFNEQEKDLLKKYQNNINSIVGIYANACGNKELPEQIKTALENLTNELKNTGFDNVVFKQIEIMYQQNPDIFNNMSEKDFAILMNKITHNNYSEAIGDKNPKYLYKESPSESSSSYDLGFSQPTPNSIILTALTNKQELELQYGINPNNEKYETALASKQTDTVTSPKEKYNSIKTLTAQDIYDGLANNYIKIYDVLDNYKDLTQSAKDYINCLIEKMPPAVQNYILDGVGGHEVLEIVRHINIPRKVLENITLDYNSRKELEGMEDEKIATNK